MAEVTTEDLSIQIGGLRHYVRKVDGGWLPTTEWTRQHFAPTFKLVEELKKQSDEMHKEIVKNPVTEYWEAAGFDGIAAGIEKLYEGEGLGTAFKYWMSNGAGAFAAIVIGGIGVYLAGKLTNIQRSIQEFFSRDGLIRGYDADGNVTRQTREAIETRERRVANGGTSLADLVGNETNVAQTRALREQLALLNPEVLKFNNRAPAFIRNFDLLPNERKAGKAAAAVDKIADAVGRINKDALASVARNIGKLADRMGQADPLHLSKVAEAIGRLVAAAKDLKPEMIPKARPIQDTATAMDNLAQKVQPLEQALRELRTATGQLNTVLDGN
ncbi:hypothetical protein GCM10017562_45140 [Streptomyces roseofulvus]|uniref:Uncharacterized protein n=2 Tax=Streptomyces TaxID=1883 RepID=A0ABU4K8Y2_9ACTN|nr:hypothetical protein [Streptomyces roseolus]MDX2293897.1 hypothetical protein [Streptomyces roseolus]